MQSKQAKAEALPFTVGFFQKGIKQTAPTKNISILDFAEMVRTGKYASQVQSIRQATTKSQQDDLKKELPYITTSGTFSQRADKNLVEHSGLIQVDIDHVPQEEREILRAYLKEDKYIFLLFDSPTNTGLKVVVKIPPKSENHHLHFQALEAYFLEKYATKIDTSCKDLSRAMFMSHDEHLHHNPDSLVFDALPAQTDYEALHKAYTKDFAKATYQKGERHEDVFSLCVEWVEQSSKPHRFVDGDKSNFRFCLASLLCEFGVSESEALAYISQNYASASGEAKDREDVRCAYKKATPNTRTFVPYSEYKAQKDKERERGGKESRATQREPPKNTTQPKPTFFSIKTMNNIVSTGMQKEPLRRMFGEFVKSNEFVIFFGDNGTGKSLLMVQVANEIAKANNPLGLENEHAPQKVLYFDFELSDRNFAKRYGNRETGEAYNFSENFFRCEIDMQAFNDLPADSDYTEELMSNIRHAIVEYQAQIIVIDNITGISLKDLGKVENALPLLQKLNALKIEFGITLIVLAHPTKQIDYKPLQKTQLSGSKKLSDLVDSIFAIGKCAYDEELRYLIDLKNRNGEAIHHKNNVFVMRKFQEPAFVGFKPEGTQKEAFLLLTNEEMEEEREKEQQEAYIVELWRNGTTQVQIAKKMGISQGQVSKIIDKARQKGAIPKTEYSLGNEILE